MLLTPGALPETSPALLRVRTCEKNIGEFTEVRCSVKDAKRVAKRDTKARNQREERVARQWRDKV